MAAWPRGRKSFIARILTHIAHLQAVIGLRIAEAVMLRGQDIDLATGVVRVTRATKGGLDRLVPIPPEQQDLFMALRERAEKHSDGYIFQGRGSRGKSLVKRTQRAVATASRRLGITHWGTRGFRRTYAQTRHAALLAAGLADGEARDVVSHELGHRRRAVSYAYVPRPQ